ncbi:hypothetical protein OROHE_011677 [Orobanche hederae]
MTNPNSQPLYENIHGSATPVSLFMTLGFPILTYSWEIESDSVEMVSETQFPSLRSEGDGVHLSKSLEVVPESEPVRSPISELKNHTYVYESMFPDSGYDAWVVNDEVLMDELPPPIVRKEKTKEERIRLNRLSKSLCSSCLPYAKDCPHIQVEHLRSVFLCSILKTVVAAVFYSTISAQKAVLNNLKTPNLCTGQIVFKLLKEGGVFDEIKVSFFLHKCDIWIGENTIVKKFKSIPHNRRLMDRLINSLDQDGPFVAEYMMFDHYGDTEVLNQYYKEKGKWKLGEMWQPTDSKCDGSLAPCASGDGSPNRLGASFAFNNYGGDLTPLEFVGCHISSSFHFPFSW